MESIDGLIGRYAYVLYIVNEILKIDKYQSMDEIATEMENPQILVDEEGDGMIGIVNEDAP